MKISRGSSFSSQTFWRGDFSVQYIPTPSMNLLPEEIIPTVLCYTCCSGYKDEHLGGNDDVEIAICNANGYLLEFCNKRIVNSCYIPIEDAAELQVYYQFTRDGYAVYYLLRNESGVMVIIKKWKDTLIVMGCYNNIRNWKIFDFKNKGYPQLGVYYFDNDTVNILNLAEFDSFKLGVDNHFVDEMDTNHSRNISLLSNDDTELNELLGVTDEDCQSQNRNLNITDFLAKKLQAMELYNNELKYEVYKMNMILKNSCKNKTPVIDKCNVSQVKFTKSWHRIHLGYWILGMEFWSSGIRDVKKIKIVTAGKDFASYTYRVFSLSDKAQVDVEEEGRGNEDGHSAARKSIVVVALKVPDFEQKTRLTAALAFIHDGYQFDTDTFHLNPEHFFQEKYQVFHKKDEDCLCEDLMSCLTVRKEIGLTVEMKYKLGITVESVLRERLGFTNAELIGENYFIKETGDLAGTCVSSTRILSSWNLRVFVTDYTVLRIFIGVLHSELPKPCGTVMNLLPWETGICECRIQCQFTSECPNVNGHIGCAHRKYDICDCNHHHGCHAYHNW